MQKPTDLPAALDEIERLTSDLRAARTTIDEMFREIDQETANLRTALDRVLALCDEADAKFEHHGIAMAVGPAAVRAAVAGPSS